jgi:hypothetical protein
MFSSGKKMADEIWELLKKPDLPPFMEFWCKENLETTYPSNIVIWEEESAK